MHSIPSRAADASRGPLLVFILCITAVLLAMVGCSGQSPTAQESVAVDAAWQKLPTRTTATLRAVAGSSASDVFAVGDDGTILHFNGVRWVPMASPTTETLRGVICDRPDNAFACGDNGTVLHYDGTAWTAIDAETTDDLGPMTGEGPYAIIVDRDQPGVIRTLEWYPAGHFWHTQDTGTGKVINDIEGLSGGGGFSLFVVCDAGTGRYVDGGWQPLEAGSADLVSVFGSAPGNAFILDAEGTLWNFRGHTDGIPVAGAGAPMTVGVLRGYDDIVLFGPGGRVVRYDRCELSTVRTHVTADFHGACVVPGGDVFAVGDGGTVLRYHEPIVNPCPDNVAVRIGPGPSPTLSWSPPCPVSKVMITALEDGDYGNWFIASDGNHIESGIMIGEVPDCATELRPQFGVMEPGQLYRLTLVRRDVTGDLTVGFYNIRAGAGAQTLSPVPPGSQAAPAAIEGLFVQPLELILLPEPGQPVVLGFAGPRKWDDLEEYAGSVETGIQAVVRVLTRDPDTGEVKILQLDDVPVMKLFDRYAVEWPRYIDL